MDNPEIWYLRKHDDGAVYGPVTIDTLRDWAAAAKISPLDHVSRDGEKTWDRAPMIGPLHMDWLVEVSEDFLYGPTTISTVQEFLANGEIDRDTIVINCKENLRTAIREYPVFGNAPKKTPALINPVAELPVRTSSDRTHDLIALQKKIFELESLNSQHRRTIEGWKQRYQALHDNYLKATGKEP